VDLDISGAKVRFNPRATAGALMLNRRGAIRAPTGKLWRPGAVPPAMMLFFVVLTDLLSQGTLHPPSFSGKKTSAGVTCFPHVVWCSFSPLVDVFTRGNIATYLGKSAEPWIWVRDGEAETIEAFTALISRPHRFV